MEKIKRLLLLFCCGCILYGLLEDLLPKKGVFAAVRVTAALYLILLVLSVGRGQTELLTSANAFSAGVPSISFEADADAVNEKTALVLQEKLADALREGGFACELTSVRFDENETDGGVTLTVTASEQEREKIQRLCNGMLGFTAAYIWTGE